MLQAHGLTDLVGDKTALEVVPIGFVHMLLGWDHMLFMAAVVLLARQPKRARPSSSCSPPATASP